MIKCLCEKKKILIIHRFDEKNKSIPQENRKKKQLRYAIMIAKKGIRIANLRLIYSTAHLIYSAVKAFYATF